MKNKNHLVILPFFFIMVDSYAGEPAKCTAIEQKNKEGKAYTSKDFLGEGKPILNDFGQQILPGGIYPKECTDGGEKGEICFTAWAKFGYGGNLSAASYRLDRDGQVISIDPVAVKEFPPKIAKALVEGGKISIGTMDVQIPELRSEFQGKTKKSGKDIYDTILSLNSFSYGLNKYDQKYLEENLPAGTTTYGKSKGPEQLHSPHQPVSNIGLQHDFIQLQKNHLNEFARIANDDTQFQTILASMGWGSLETYGDYIKYKLRTDPDPKKSYFYNPQFSKILVNPTQKQEEALKKEKKWVHDGGSRFYIENEYVKTIENFVRLGKVSDEKAIEYKKIIDDYIKDKVHKFGVGHIELGPTEAYASGYLKDEQVLSSKAPDGSKTLGTYATTLAVSTAMINNVRKILGCFNTGEEKGKLFGNSNYDKMETHLDKTRNQNQAPNTHK